MIKVPYNFVPINEKVFLPNWAPFISHDIPFENGLSGEIYLKIKNDSPLFVRNGGSPSGEGIVHQFSQTEDGTYFIPGSTQKGTIRAVLEILSMGKLSKVNDYKYSIRNLNYHFYREEIVNKSGEIKMGWLKSTIDDNQQITHFIRTSMSEEYATDNNNQRAGRQNIQANRLPFADVKKYLGSNYKENTKNGAEKYFKILKNRQSYNSEDFTSFKINANGEPRVIVLTGKFSRQKNKEFLFPDPWQTDSAHKDLVVSEKQVADFLSAYDTGSEKEDGSIWHFWRPYFKKGCFIPVFFLTDESGTVKHFGLSQLYKRPFEFSVKDLIAKLDNARHLGEQPDLAECLFGYITKDKPILKGRVQFGHAFAKEGTAIPDNPLKKLLATPKASYYPFYIEQNQSRDGTLNNSFHASYDHNNSQISGRKRYPVQRQYQSRPSGGKDKMLTKFVPLKSGAEFYSKVRFHNLLPVELGALLSALTFHQNETRCYHQIGMGKPFGLGNCRLEIQKLKVSNLPKTHPNRELFRHAQVADFLALFEKAMITQTPNWLQSETIKELLNMASPQDNKLQKLEYMGYEGYGQLKQRDHKKGLPRYSSNIPSTDLLEPKSIPLKEDFQNLLAAEDVFDKNRISQQLMILIKKN